MNSFISSRNKVFSIILFLTIVAATINVRAAAFTAGNILVERVGAGLATLNSGATNLFIDEYLPGTASQSSPVQGVSLPSVSPRPTANPFNLMDSGSASSDGQMTRSVDGSVIEMPGYNGIPGDAGIVNSDGATIPRVIGIINSSTSIDTSRTMNAYTNGNNFRSVISVNGSAFWCAGANSAASSSSLRGIVYFAGSTATKLFDVNARYINIASNQLFYSTQSGTVGIYALGSGLPTSGSPTASLVIGPTGGSPAPEAFQFNPATNICYIADSRASKGGVFKYSYTGGVWVSNYLFSVSGGAFGLAVDWSGANPVIYATTADGKNLFKITDTGSGSTVTVLATVDGSTKAFHGVALAPKSQTYSITGTTVNNDGSITLTGISLPNNTNVVMRTTSLTPPINWTPVGTNTTDGAGNWQTTDPSPTDPAFYRAVTQP